MLREIIEGLHSDERVDKLQAEVRELRALVEQLAEAALRYERSERKSRDVQPPVRRPCPGTKKKYDSHTHALNDAAALMRKGDGANAYNVYRCRTCNAFHVGSTSRAK